jgi:hypothetical protein
MKISKIQYVPHWLHLLKASMLWHLSSLSLPISFHIPHSCTCTHLNCDVFQCCALLWFVENLWFWSFEVSEIKAHWAPVFWKKYRIKRKYNSKFLKISKLQFQFSENCQNQKNLERFITGIQRTSNFHERKNRQFRVVSLTLVLWLFGTPVKGQKPVLWLFREPPVKGEK